MAALSLETGTGAFYLFSDCPKVCIPDIDLYQVLVASGDTSLTLVPRQTYRANQKCLMAAQSGKTGTGAFCPSSNSPELFIVSL